MVDILSMVDLTSISAILAAVGVFVGVVFAVLQLRDLVETRQTDLVIRLHSAFSSRDFQEAWAKVMACEYKDYNDFVKKYGPFMSEKPVHIAYLMVGAYYEEIGVLLQRKLIDLGLISQLSPVSLTWKKMKPIAEGMRKLYNEPRAYEWFEYLYNEMQKKEQQLATIQ
jgi:hypothetical protein